mmetsp:Transcript_6002/g.17170  ORF Transcript_6002/g.17170 Transcript_6002/m.17170 type:complete len:223 (+) Transcript_6002:410-1078(+)
MSEPAANGVGADGDLHDMKAVWDRWISILRRHGWGPDAVLQAPSTDAEIDAALEKAGSLSLPAAVRELYLLNDGQESPSNVANIATNIFPGYEFLPVPKALAAWQTWRDVRNAYTVDGESDMDEPITVRASDEGKVKRVYTHPAWWPLAEDGGGNHLMVDMDPGPFGTAGQIIIAGPDEDERRVLAPGIVQYIEALAAAELNSPQEDAMSDGVAWWDAPGLR